MDDKELLTKHVGGDLIALEAKHYNAGATMYYNGVKSKIWEGQFTFQSIKKFRQGTLLDWVNNLDEFSYDIEAPTSYFWVSL